MKSVCLIICVFFWFCEFTVEISRNFRLLVKEYHKGSSRIERLNRNRNAYRCDGCRNGFGTQVQLHAHHCRCSKDPKGRCLICYTSTTSTMSLIEHLAQKHFPQDINFRCPFRSCGEGFFYLSSFLQHIRAHYGFKCLQPGCSRRFKAFATRCNLEDHIKMHLGLMKFSCDICPKQPHFANKARLNAHKKRKTHIKWAQWQLDMKNHNKSNAAK